MDTRKNTAPEDEMLDGRKYRLKSSDQNIYHQMTPRGMTHILKEFCGRIPYLVWSAFIHAFLIPQFRPEWGRYSVWEPNYDPTLRTGKQIQYRTVPKNFHNHHECSRVMVNVSGTLFETQMRTLNRFPDTLLGNPRRRLRYFDPQTQQYFFDRHASCFEGIFNYYQNGGSLRRPPKVTMDMFFEECKFFEINDVDIQTLRNNEGYPASDENKIMPESLWKRKLWLLFEYPESSSQARIVAYLSIYVIILSIVIFCMETMEAFNLDTPTNVHKIKPRLKKQSRPLLLLSDPFFFVETVCIIWFTLELIARFCSCPNKVAFVTSIMNVIDSISIFPYFINTAETLWADDPDEMESDTGEKSKANSFAFLRVIRLVRVFRIFKLSRHSKGLQILGLTLKASIRELALLLFFIAVGVVLFASVVYSVEYSTPNSPFKSIPDAFWWGVITLTTVGYGDEIPKTELGRIIAALCCVTGVLAISIPVPVIVSNFNYFYHQDKDKQGPEDLEGVNPDQVEMCPFLPGTYDSHGRRMDLHLPHLDLVNHPEVRPLDAKLSSHSLEELLKVQPKGMDPPRVSTGEKTPRRSTVRKVSQKSTTQRTSKGSPRFSNPRTPQRLSNPQPQRRTSTKPTRNSAGSNPNK